MSISFLYYLWMLLSLSSGDLAGTHKNPVHHMGAVQIYYFYDSRIPSAIGDAMCGLTKDVLEKNYTKQYQLIKCTVAVFVVNRYRWIRVLTNKEKMNGQV